MRRNRQKDRRTDWHDGPIMRCISMQKCVGICVNMQKKQKNNFEKPRDVASFCIQQRIPFPKIAQSIFVLFKKINEKQNNQICTCARTIS